ncbi:Multiple C2 and transmembrane domain-containing protein 2 [Apophysomyces sp. BC1034]|nr:Multiple C2 and transmembrane domain-containing protein 2 [Apophysomyces sp. BC1015]KAG0178122.1 Multiple C2 and transmembrane domain-containing protein 2 [Apophysomyces sp. BC1021]KAG0187430.1 Multiple C2 and transmembrane domain-containing protein 2 [Apophysomyces sp. BC1034]
MSNLKLRVGLISARGLAAADKTGFSDPYAVARVNGKKYTTKVIKQTLDPIWDYAFEIPIQQGKLPTLISIAVWDKDTFGRDFLGEISIPVKNMFDRNNGGFSDGVPRHYADPANQAAWFTLNKRSEKNNVSGEIQIKFGFMEQHVRDYQQYLDAWQQLIN